MLKKIESYKINKNGLIATPFLLLLAFMGRRALGMQISWICLPLFSSIALILQFGFEPFKTFFTPMKKGSKKIVLLYILILLVLATALAKLGVSFFHIQTASNARVDGGLQENALLFFLTSWVSIIGEELFIAAIVFPLYHYLKKKFSTNKAFALASLLSGLVFGMIHLPVYSWNLYQCFVIVGLMRIPLNYVWKKTDSLRGGIYTHIIYDYIGFFIQLISLF
ncbi:CPBP family intramembrane glutamic endopeptidase [Enterococcus sp. AZ109]|uniref:CPBP family intramembrane glutamic endopeptidase n=1 Tax=Enterococcus sp. AZ109 TaxID=2774634 RepID=UPI003F25EDDA